MKTIILFLSVLLLAGALLPGCRKSDHQPLHPSVALGTVIGYDQCTADIRDSSAKGYVIKIEAVKGKDTIVVDTAMTYNLPNVFVFHPQFFVHYQFTYLFPPGYRDKYKFKFSYKITPKQDKVYYVCKADIWLAPINEATKGEQITITKFYDKIP